MGFIGIFKPLSTVLRSVINKSRQHQGKNSCECRELNLGLLGEKQVCHLCALQPLNYLYLSNSCRIWAHRGEDLLLQHPPLHRVDATFRRVGVDVVLRRSHLVSHPQMKLKIAQKFSIRFFDIFGFKK